MHYPSILNDVIGPVMRGPSSSHCAAALRIGRMARDLMDGEIEEVLVEFDANGSLATTHESQGSDMGLLGGLLGWDATDERLAESARWIGAGGHPRRDPDHRSRRRASQHLPTDAQQLDRAAHHDRHLHRRRHDRGGGD